MRRTPRILLVVDRFPTPSETFIAARFVHLVERGWDVHILCNESRASELEMFPAIAASAELRSRVHHRMRTRPRLLAAALVPYIVIAALLRSPRTVLRYLTRGWRREGAHVLRRIVYDANLILLTPDVIHFTFGWFAVGKEHLRDMLGAKVIVSFQGGDLNYGGLDEDPGFYSDVWGAADALHFLSEDLRERGRRRGYLPDGRDVVVTPGIDLSAFAAARRDRPPDEPMRILSVGRLHWKKGYDYALHAVRMLRDDGVDCRYRIVGDGPDRDAVLYARRDLGLEDTVELLGALPSDQTRAEMQWADVFLHASTSEGFCYAAVEAQAMELPVVTSDADGLRENVADGTTGFVVPRRDPGALATALSKLARDPELRRRMGSAGRERALRVFDVMTEIEGFEQLYRTTLTR